MKKPNKEQVKKAAIVTKTIGGRIFLEGSKVVVAGALMVAFDTMLSGGFRSLKSLNVNQLLEIEEEKTEDEDNE